MMLHTFNFSTQKAEGGGFLCSLVYIVSSTPARQGCIVRLCLKKNIVKAYIFVMLYCSRKFKTDAIILLKCF